MLSVVPLALLWHTPLWAWRVNLLVMLLTLIGYGFAGPWPWSPVQIGVSLAVLLVLAAREPFWVTIWAGATTVAVAAVEVEPGEGVLAVCLVIVLFLVFGHQTGRKWSLLKDLSVQNERGDVLVDRRILMAT